MSASGACTPTSLWGTHLEIKLLRHRHAATRLQRADNVYSHRGPGEPRPHWAVPSCRGGTQRLVSVVSLCISVTEGEIRWLSRLCTGHSIRPLLQSVYSRFGSFLKLSTAPSQL